MHPFCVDFVVDNSVMRQLAKFLGHSNNHVHYKQSVQITELQELISPDHDAAINDRSQISSPNCPEIFEDLNLLESGEIHLTCKNTNEYSILTSIFFIDSIMDFINEQVSVSLDLIDISSDECKKCSYNL